MKSKNLLFICLLLSFYLKGQEQGSKFRHITSKNGLSQSSISCILKDSQGFMWFGTEDGLNKYDGKKITVYRHIPDDDTSLSSSYINTAIEDENGFLWIGTKNGLNYFNPDTEKFTRYFQNSQNAVNSKHEEIISLSKLEGANLVLGTANGVYTFNTETGFIKYTLENKSNPTIMSVKRDIEGNIWVLSFDGNFEKIEVKNGSLGKSEFQKSFENIECYTMFLDTSDIWIGTNIGLMRFNLNDHNTKIVEFYPSENTVHKKNSVHIIIPTGNNILTIGTHAGGLIRFDKVSHRYETIVQDPDNLLSLNSNSIRSLLLDKNNILWVGTLGGGVNKYDPNQFKFKHYKFNSTNKNNFNENSVRSILTDRDDELWVGTHEGLSRINRQSNNNTIYRYNPEDETSVSSNTVRALAEDSMGVVWAGTWSNGLNSFDKRTNVFKRYTDVPMAKKNGYPVRALKVDGNDNIWIGGTGLWKFDQKTSEFKSYFTDGIDSYAIHNLYFDKKGLLWVGTYQNGLICLDTKSAKVIQYKSDLKNSTSLSHNYITSIAEDSQRNLWVGTYGGGINMLNPSKGIFKRYNTSNGLLNDVIYGILIDRDDVVWHTSNKGLARYDKEINEFKYFGVEHGIQSDEFNAGAYFKSVKGEFFFGGINGLNSFFPNSIFSNQETSKIVFTDFKVLNDEKTVTSDLQERHISRSEEITLDYNQNTFAIEFAELNYSENSYNKYEYKLDGFEKEWKNLGKKQQITIGNLKPGNYILTVRVDDDLSKQTAIEIAILPAPWQTKWAYLSYAVLLMLIGLLIYRSIKKTSRIREEFEQKIKNWEKSNGNNHNSNQKESLTTLLLKKVKTTSMNQKFLEGAIKIVEDNIENSDFDVERFADEMYVSRSQLHRKLKSQAGYSTTEFIRLIRLKRAAQLLAGNVGTVSEIAYKVGFENVGYFSKCFREAFGKTPSQYSQDSKLTVVN